MPENDAGVEAVCGSRCTEYKLVINNGRGDGNYCPEAKVPIVAGPCPVGQVFDKWVVLSGDPTIANTLSEDTTLQTSDEDSKVERTCKCKEFKLTIDNGSGDGDYCPETEVRIVAEPCPVGEVFDKWVVLSGDPTIANTFSEDTTLQTSDEDSKVERTCKPLPVPTSPPVRTRRPTRNPGATRRPVRPNGSNTGSAFPSLVPSETPSETPTRA